MKKKNKKKSKKPKARSCRDQVESQLSGSSRRQRKFRSPWSPPRLQDRPENLVPVRHYPAAGLPCPFSSNGGNQGRLGTGSPRQRDRKWSLRSGQHGNPDGGTG